MDKSRKTFPTLGLVVTESKSKGVERDQRSVPDAGGDLKGAANKKEKKKNERQNRRPGSENVEESKIDGWA